MAFREGVISPTISAGEFALTGPTGGIRNILLRNLTVGVIFGSGEALRDITVADEVPTFEEFAATTAIFSAGGVVLDGVFFVGGRAIALVRQGGRSAAVDITAQIGATQAPDALTATPLGQLIQQAQRETEQAFAAVRAGQPVFQTSPKGTLDQLLRLERNVFAGQAMEITARRLAQQRGEIILETQFRQGAAMRGIDFASFLRTPEGVQLFLNEVSATAGVRSPGSITAFGLGRGGQRILRQNLRQVERAIETQVPAELREALRLEFAHAPLRLIGPQGFRITETTESLIQTTTGRDVLILVVP